MKIEEWKALIKGAKTAKETGFNGLNLKIMRGKGGQGYIILNYQKCDCCGQIILKAVKIEFYKAIEHLTIFEAELLYLLFCEGAKPRDYANYHKCEAGREFILNIKNIETA